MVITSGEDTTCPMHPDEPVIGFCYRCKRPVCRLCGRPVNYSEELLKGVKVKNMIVSMGYDKMAYVCEKCDKTRLSFSLDNIVALISGFAIFFLGLLIEFMPLAVVGAFVFLGAIYGIVT